MRRLLPALPFVVLALVASAVFADEKASAPAAGPVNFARDVEPIFRAHCVGCHNVDNPEGGLALDTMQTAKRGGASGSPILGGPLDKNELWHRVATPEPDFRMPKDRPPLSAHDLGVLKRWIHAGSPWTTDQGVVVEDEDIAALGPGLRDVANDMLNVHAPILLALCIVLLLAVRARKKGKGGWARAITWVQPAHVVIVLCTLMLVSAMGVLRQESKEKDALNIKLLKSQEQSHIYAYLFGDPPRPVHPPIGKTLEAKYYRGNDERGPHLYNYGRYRTATLGLTLRDKRGKQLRIGDPVPADGLFMQYDIERSPNSAGRMYATDRMESVFLTKVWFDHRTITKLSQPAVFLDTVKKDWAWKASIPLGRLPDGTHSTMYYVYVHHRTDGRPFSPQLHYGLQADLVIEDGKIAEGSDLWLGNLLWNTGMEPPPVKFSLPAHEWLSSEPIPEIEDGHSYHEEREREAATTRPGGGH